MSNTQQHKAWREKNREYWNAYKKAWARKSRGSKKKPEFPKMKKGHQDSRLPSIKNSGENPVYKEGKCSNCSSKLKEGEEKRCNYCVNKYPDLSTL